MSERERAAMLLPLIDNPMNEDRWNDARAIADRAGLPRRGMANRLEVLERQGLVEPMRDGHRASMWSDPPPRLWRRRRDA
jgi:DNA-binding IclR family transcriptional regulator